MRTVLLSKRLSSSVCVRKAERLGQQAPEGVKGRLRG